MNLYEHTIIARQDTSPSEIKQLTEKYSSIIEKNDGEIVKTENWGLLNLSYLIKKIVGFDGKIIFDSKMPNGVNRKVLDISILKSIGWKPKIKLEHGISRLYQELGIQISK